MSHITPEHCKFSQNKINLLQFLKLTDATEKFPRLFFTMLLRDIVAFMLKFYNTKGASALKTGI